MHSLLESWGLSHNTDVTQYFIAIVDISVHNRREPLFPHPVRRAFLCLTPEQKSIIASDGSLTHTYSSLVWCLEVRSTTDVHNKSMVQSMIVPLRSDQKKADGWRNIIMFQCIQVLWNTLFFSICISIYISWCLTQPHERLCEAAQKTDVCMLRNPYHDNAPILILRCSIL